MAEQRVLVVDREDADLVRRTAAERGVERVVGALWTRARPAVLAARARGGEASSSWRT